MLRLQKTTLQITTLYIFSVVLPTVAIRSLESDPASDGGVLTAEVGQQISLTCSHDNDASSTSRWRISAPIECDEAVVHTLTSELPNCGPFSLTRSSRIDLFASTANATATTSMTGAVVQCFDGVGLSAVQVGSNITLCVYDNPPPPANLQCQPMSGGVVEISWSPVPQDCTMSSVYYRINITSIGGNVTAKQGTIFSTSVQISLTPGEEYVATLTTVVNDTVRSTTRVSESINCTFTAEQVVNVNTFSTTAVLPTTSSSTDTSNTAEKTELDTTTAVVITFVVTTVIMLIVGVVFGSLATFFIMKKRKSTPGITHQQMELLVDHFMNKSLPLMLRPKRKWKWTRMLLMDMFNSDVEILSNLTIKQYQLINN